MHDVNKPILTRNEIIELIKATEKGDRKIVLSNGMNGILCRISHHPLKQLIARISRSGKRVGFNLGKRPKNFVLKVKPGDETVYLVYFSFAEAEPLIRKLLTDISSSYFYVWIAVYRGKVYGRGNNEIYEIMGAITNNVPIRIGALLGLRETAR